MTWLLIIIFGLANGIVILTAGKLYRDRHRSEQRDCYGNFPPDRISDRRRQ